MIASNLSVATNCCGFIFITKSLSELSISCLQRNHQLALRYTLRENWETYKSWMNKNQDENTKMMMEILQTVVKDSTVRVERLTQDLDEVKWKGNKREMELEKELDEMNEKLLHRQIVCVLEERVKAVAGWGSYQLSFTDLYHALKRKIDKVRPLGSQWIMTDEEVSVLSAALIQFFPGHFKDNFSLLILLADLKGQSHDARLDAKSVAHNETISEDDLIKETKSTEYEILVEALQRTKDLVPFRGKTLLKFLEVSF